MASMPPERRWEQQALREMRSDIHSAIDCEHMLPLFMSKGILSTDDTENMESPIRSQRNKKFLDHIIEYAFDTGTISSYQCLMDYLIDGGGHPTLKKRLSQKLDEVKSRDSVHPPPSGVTIHAPMEDSSFRSDQSASESNNTSILANSTGSFCTDGSSAMISSTDTTTSSEPVDYVPGQAASPLHNVTAKQTQQNVHPFEHSTPRGEVRPNHSITEQLLASPITRPGENSRPSGQYTADVNFRPDLPPTRRSTGVSSISTTTTESSIIAEATTEHDQSPQLTRSSPARSHAFPEGTNGHPAYTAELPRLAADFQPGMPAIPGRG